MRRAAGGEARRDCTSASLRTRARAPHVEVPGEVGVRIGEERGAWVEARDETLGHAAIVIGLGEASGILDRVTARAMPSPAAIHVAAGEPVAAADELPSRSPRR